MERKGGSTVVVTAETVATALQHTTATREEEQVLRMRYGAKVATTEKVGAAEGASEELADELLLMELQLLRGLKAHQARLKKATAPRNAAKDKIVRALKAKKK